MEAPHCTGSFRLAATARGSGLDALALANLHSRLVVDGGGSHALLNLSRHCQESLLNVGRVLGGSLKEGDSETVGKLLYKSKMMMSVNHPAGTTFSLSSCDIDPGGA
jgi:hypothetical protein